MSGERLCIIDAKGEETGESRPRNEVHRLGLLHRAVHVWVVNDKLQVLLQRRTQSKKFFPGQWLCSGSGHIAAGDNSIQTASKELEEEVGIRIPALVNGQSNPLFQLMFRIWATDVIETPIGVLRNREYQHIYLVRASPSLSELKLQTSEVADAQWVPIDILHDLFLGKDPCLVPASASYVEQLFQGIIRLVLGARRALELGKSVQEGKVEEGGVIHMVLLKFQPTATQEQISAVLRSGPELTAIPGVVTVTVGPVLIAARAKGYTHVLHVTLESKRALRLYTAHPLHVSMKNRYLIPILSDALAVDIITPSPSKL